MNNEEFKNFTFSIIDDLFKNDTDIKVKIEAIFIILKDKIDQTIFIDQLKLLCLDIKYWTLKNDLQNIQMSVEIFIGVVRLEKLVEIHYIKRENKLNKTEDFQSHICHLLNYATLCGNYDYQSLKKDLLELLESDQRNKILDFKLDKLKEYLKK